MSVFGAIGHWFEGLWKAISAQLKVTLEAFLKSFVIDDLGALAVDAVNYIESTMQGADGVVKRDAAVAKFKVDASAAGHDIETFSVSLLNFFIETAIQAITTQA